MKKLVLAAFTAVLAMAASGCVINGGSGDDGPDDFATITAKWSIKNLASNDNNLPCPPGTTSASLYNQIIDDNGELVGSPAIDIFDCDDFEGRAEDLEPDIYQTWVTLHSTGGANVYAESLSAIVDVIDVDKTFETTILEDGGYFMLSWTLRAANGGGVLTCAQAGATTIGIDLDDTPVDFPCEAGSAVSSGFISDTYVFSVSAVDSKGPLGDVMSQNLEIRDRNQVTDLGHFDLPID